MCGIIVGLFLLVIAGALMLFGFTVIGEIVAVILFLAAVGRYSNSKKLTPSRMVCPNCRSQKVHLSSVISGVSHGSVGSFYGGLSMHQGGANINRQRVATCADCGFSYPYIMPDEVKAEQNTALGFLIMATVFLALATAFTVAVFVAA